MSFVLIPLLDLSDSDLGKSWRPSGLSYVLGSGVTRLEDLCLDGLFCVLWVLLGGVT